jgi:hypothetical protein
MVNSVDSTIVDHPSLFGQFLYNCCSSSTCSSGTEGSVDELPGNMLPSTACWIAIAYVLIKVFGVEEDETKWVSQNGIATKIHNALVLGTQQTQPHCCDNTSEVIWCREEMIEYTGDTKQRHGRSPTISVDGKEAQIVADCQETGFSLRLTKWMANQH